MGLNDLVRAILGRKPVKMGDLATEVTQRPRRVAHVPEPDPLAGIEIIPEYRQVEAILDTGWAVTFVTGGAGTGKSTLIRYLDAATGHRMVVLAPTGVAALNAGGVTIHSFCRLPPRIIQEADVRPPRDRQLVRALDVMVVDEISMVRPDMLDAVDRFLRITRENESPFGGVRMILMGDLFQLPPVVRPQEERVLRAMGYGSDFFFAAKSLEHVSVAPILLERVFRQRDPDFIDLLTDLRVGNNVQSALGRINTRTGAPPADGLPELVLTSTNAGADRRNEEKLAALSGTSRTYEGQATGRFALKETKLPAPVNLELKAGAQVMFTKNDSQKRWVNGTLGIVREFADDHVSVEVEREGIAHRYRVQRQVWEEFRYRYNSLSEQIEHEVTGTYTQFPLMLAWAVTIHKAQGKTLDRVLVDLGDGAFASGQVYVALSRVRSLDDLRLARPVRERDVRCDPEIARFYQLMEEKASTEEQEEV